MTYEFEIVAEDQAQLDRPKDTRNAAKNRLLRAANDFHDASRLARKHGFLLVCHNDVHYQIRPDNGSWLLNIYPGNRRLYTDTNYPNKAPFLADKLARMPGGWTLKNIVLALIQLQETNNGACDQHS